MACKVAGQVENDLNDIQIDQLLKTVNVTYGYDFSDYSKSSLKRRISYFMSSNRIQTLDELTNYILNDEKQFISFLQSISVTVTEMFRDPSFYKSLRNIVLPRAATYPVIKIWIAGCATGEEVYSTAILLKEEGLLKRSIIYATDINQNSLQIAREGIYPLNIIDKYEENYKLAEGKKKLSDYYQAKFNSFLMNRDLKEQIVFSPHNLVLDKSFNEFQLIICRNVLIYFNQKLQNKVVNLFYESLCMFGFLALGNKESLLFSEKQKRFEEKDKKEKIFMKIS
jgi:chemotaxis protein methyltransferase CheR